ncbi:MAG: HlyD family type I secretion periplasmic adaptor subunit [Pseudomonadota bacterium]|nr:HlyD family type I secretion periplasmic adaptor subunit [Pseudomonadota bacterium]
MSENVSSSSATEVVDKSPMGSVKKDIESFSVLPIDALPKVDSDYNRYRHLGFLILFVIFGLFGGWASLAPLSSASVAVGEVFVVSNNRVVEHFEGGIVSDILVQEGDIVEQGQVLLKLSSTQAEAELAIVQSQLNEVLGLEARLQAESRLADKISFPAELLSNQASGAVQDILKGQASVFFARKDALEGELEIYRQRVKALKEQIIGLKTVISTLDDRIASFKQEVKDWEALFKEQFADKIRLQEMKRELARLKGEKGSHQSEIARLLVSITENEAQLLLRKQQFRESVVSELRTVQSERVDLHSKKVALKDRLNRVSITAPVSGQVNGLTVFTVGDVVGSGETLMEIVPSSKDYAVKAKVMVTDIDKVNVGLIADVRFSAFNTQMTHVIEGKVVHVSADKFEDLQTGFEYFEAKVMLTPSGILQMEKDGIFLLPGMPAEVMIKTGERTLLGYFIKPFMNMFARSFNEE